MVSFPVHGILTGLRWHRHERLKPSREAEIKMKMMEMPAKIEQWRKDKNASKQVLGSELAQILRTDLVSY